MAAVLMPTPLAPPSPVAGTGNAGGRTRPAEQSGQRRPEAGKFGWNPHTGSPLQGYSWAVLASPSCVHLISGAVAGGVSRTLTAPLDRLKAVLQVTRSARRIPALATLKRLVREDGVFALFRGNGANCVKVVPESAIKFVAYDFFKRRVIALRHRSDIPTDGRDLRNEIETEHAVPLSLGEKLLAGGLAGVVAQLCIYPMEVVKTRLAISPTKSFTGIRDCIRKTLRLEGPKAFYRGLCPSLLGIIPYAGLDLSCYETLKREYCIRCGHDPPLLVVLACGGISSAIGQVAAYPLVLVRTRMQADGIGGAVRQFHGTRDVFQQTLRNEGLFALYRGLGPNLLKAVPAVSITWAVYESCKHQLPALLTKS